MLGVPIGVLSKQLGALGFTRNAIKRHLREISLADPSFAAGRRISQRLKKLESLLEVVADLRASSSSFVNVERRNDLTRKTFFDNYYAANRPVIVTNLLNGWPAMKRWSPDYLAKRWGNQRVEVMMNRNDDPEYEINMRKHKTRVSLKTFCKMVTEGGQTNDLYLVANNLFLDDRRFRDLYNDMVFSGELLSPDHPKKSCNFWFGPAGTATKAHHDKVNVLLAQFYGRKNIKLISALETPLVYNYRGVFSEVDWEDPDFDKHPLFRKARILDVTISPGEALFIPVGWWHFVEALDVSISVAFSNFVFPNQFETEDPDLAV